MVWVDGKLTVRSHMAEFMRLNCAPDLLALKVFPNAKEITESMAAFSAVRAHITQEFGNPKIAVASIGDGNTPRTAALFAHRTGWDCYSMDPRLKRIKWYPPVKRLYAIRASSNDQVWDFSEYDQMILLFVHSHASLQDTLPYVLAQRLHIVAIPCCVPLVLPGVPYIGYSDPGIWSPQREVKVWKDVVWEGHRSHSKKEES